MYEVKSINPVNAEHISMYQQTLTRYNRWICAVDIPRFVPKSNQMDRQTEMCVCSKIKQYSTARQKWNEGTVLV